MSSTSTSTTPTTITTLPTEIIVDIFSNLDYLTLHTKIRPVCSFFNNVITSTTSGPLGIKLLRAQQNDKSEYCFEFHPCIRKLVIDLGLTATPTITTTSTTTTTNPIASPNFGGTALTDRPHDIDPKIHVGFIHPTTKTFTSVYRSHLWDEYVLFPAVPARDFLLRDHHHTTTTNPPHTQTPFLLSPTNTKQLTPTVGDFIELLLDEANENFKHWRIRNKWDLYYSGKNARRGLVDYRRIMGWISSEIYGDKFCECFGTDVFMGVSSAAQTGEVNKKGQRSRSGDRIVYQMGSLGRMLRM